LAGGAAGGALIGAFFVENKTNCICWRCAGGALLVGERCK